MSSTGTQISCPHCGQTYQLTPEQAPQYAGQTINCTKCQRAFNVPIGGDGRGSVVPPAPIAAVPYGTPAGYQQPYGGQAQQSNGWALASLITGIFGCLGVTGIFAIVAGIIGLNKTKDPRVGGKGMAIAGIVLACVTMFGGLCIGPGILLPSLNRAREQANRIKCASNMRQIGQAIQIYANANRGAFPPDLDTVLNGGMVTSAVFVCPTSTDVHAPPGTPLTSGPHLSYIYTGQGMRYTGPANAVLMYEPMTTHNDGTNVLFLDSSVQWVSKVQAEAMIAEIQAGQNPPPSGPK